jgi:DNA-directed RNA polymerase subunit omega
MFGGTLPNSGEFGYRRYQSDGEHHPMLDELREEAIVNKVGGRFKLSTLIQKRLVALNAGSRPLVDLKTDDKLQIVIQEIMQDKIYLDASANLRVTGKHDDGGGEPEFDLTNL